MKKSLKIAIFDDGRDIASLNNALLSAGINAQILQSEPVAKIKLEQQIIDTQQKLSLLQGQLEDRYKELKAVDRLKTALLRTFSNELRSPLNIIMGYSKMLQRQYFGKLNSQQLKIIEKVFLGGKNLGKSLDRVLEIAQLEADYLPLEYQKFNLNNLIREVINNVFSLAKSKNIVLEIDCDVTYSVFNGDRYRCQQILTELISNGVYFSNGGKVVISIVESSLEQLSIAIEDTGFGIAPDCIDKIFDKFWQGDRSLERQHQSLGLGLTLVKNLVEKMQGTITVESQFGRGSTFVVSLPRQASSVSLTSA